MAFDTTRLIAQVNIKGSIPEGRFTDQELLNLGYDCLLSEVVPVVLATNEDYYVTSLDLAITAGQAAYVTPSRALDGALREVKLIRGTRVIDLERMDLEAVRSTATGYPYAFYTAGNSVYLYPTPSTTQDTLRLYYNVTPSRLVPVAECARITAISTNTVTVTAPAGWTTANTFDLVRGRAPFALASPAPSSAPSIASIRNPPADRTPTPSGASPRRHPCAHARLSTPIIGPPTAPP